LAYALPGLTALARRLLRRVVGRRPGHALDDRVLQYAVFAALRVADLAGQLRVDRDGVQPAGQVPGRLQQRLLLADLIEPGGHLPLAEVVHRPRVGDGAVLVADADHQLADAARVRRVRDVADDHALGRVRPLLLRLVVPEQVVEDVHVALVVRVLRVHRLLGR